MDTIYALATAQGKAGVAIVRMSGAQAFDFAARFCDLPDPRVTGLRNILHPNGDVIDQAMVLCFQKGASFTGEDVVEFHLHGSQAVVAMMLSALGETCDARLAEPGEFTRRAFENGRLDLSQVEGLADLIDSETEVQRKQALRVMSGEMSELTDGWRKSLIQAAALLEVTIDFADEDVPVDVTPEVTKFLQQVLGDLDAQCAGFEAAERIRNGFEVAIIGAPNVGKSTLLNALAGRKAAITSEIAGTTRDVIEVRIDLRGIPVTFLDTAGLRETSDAVEAMGIDIAKERAVSADRRIYLRSSEEEPIDFPLEPNDLVVWSKSDISTRSGLGVSGLTGAGLEEILDHLASDFRERVAASSLVARERQRLCLMNGRASIGSALLLLETGAEYELVAEEIRYGAASLASLVGLVGVEDILDDVFSRFCLGK